MISKLPEYVPNRQSGLCLFNGEPAPSETTITLLGKKGINSIHKQVRELVEARKFMFGRSELHYHGLFHLQKFFDVKHRVFYVLQQLADNDSSKDIQSYQITVEAHILPWLRHGKLSDRGIRREIRSGRFHSIEPSTSKYDLPRNSIPPMDSIHDELKTYIKNLPDSEKFTE